MPRYQWLGMWTGAITFPIACAALAYAGTAYFLSKLWPDPAQIHDAIDKCQLATINGGH